MLRRRLLTCAAVAGPAALLAACTMGRDRNHDGADAPRIGAVRWRTTANDPPRKKTAWVFSSGGPRCFVHVGVLKALERMDLRPDLLVGASGGAIVAVLAAAGWRTAELEPMVLDLGATDMLRWSLGTQERWNGAGIAATINRRLQERPGTQLLEQLPVPVAVCVMEQQSRRTLAFTGGDAGIAVRASCAIEGLFTPVQVRGTWIVDPDLAMPMPVRLARELGAERVLAIDASAHEERAPPGAESYRESDLRKRALTRPDAEAADLVLHPEFGYWAGMNREYRLRCIAAGERDTLAQEQRLRALFG